MIKKPLPCSIAVKGYTAMTIFPLPVTLGLAITPPAAAVRALRTSSLTLHSGFKWLKPPKNKLLRCDFTNVSKLISSKMHHFRFRWLHIYILSNYCQHKCDQSLSQILKCNFWRIFCYLKPLRRVGRHQPHRPWPRLRQQPQRQLLLRLARAVRDRIWTASGSKLWVRSRNLLD